MLIMQNPEYNEKFYCTNCFFLPIPNSKLKQVPPQKPQDVDKRTHFASIAVMMLTVCLRKLNLQHLSLEKNVPGMRLFPLDSQLVLDVDPLSDHKLVLVQALRMLGSFEASSTKICPVYCLNLLSARV